MTESLSMPPLYKQRKDGKWQVIEYSLQHLAASSCLSIASYIYGAEETSKIVDKLSYTKGKNVGKANETTYAEQALAEMQSRHKKKLERDGYSLNMEALSTFSPMLAKSYSDIDAFIAKHEKAKAKDPTLSLPLYLQPKLDGIRCLTKVDLTNGEVTFFSRKGQDYTHLLGHMIQPLLSFPWPVIRGTFYLDGEIMSTGNIQETAGLMNKKEVSAEHASIRYIIYDSVDLFPEETRHKFLQTLTSNDPTFSFISEINTYPEINFTYTDRQTLDAKLKLYHGWCLEKGYEGAMLRISNMPYERSKRSFSLIKYKSFMDSEFLIKDIITSDKGRNLGCAIFVCEVPGGNTFTTNIEGTYEYRQELYTNRHLYIGSKLNVKYFELTPDGVPRFPVGQYIRSEEL